MYSHQSQKDRAWHKIQEFRQGETDLRASTTPFWCSCYMKNFDQRVRTEGQYVDKFNLIFSVDGSLFHENRNFISMPLQINNTLFDWYYCIRHSKL